MPEEIEHYDVAIIGAGINGAGIARDAALRGLSVVVIDKNDMCSGTSAVSSRLIHGGLRYLEYGEIPLVYESLHERRILQKIAGHLVTPLRITIPVYADARRGRFLIRLGMIVYDLLSFRKSIPGHDMLDAAQMRAEEPGLRSVGLKGAARYFDAQVTFAERLVLENLLAARAAGAKIKTYCEVSRIEVCDAAVKSLQYRDRSGASHRVGVHAVINAAGPWVDSVLAAAPATAKRFVGGTKGSHIVVPGFDGAPEDAFYVEALADGRPIFIIPWHNLYLIGTTDIRYEGSLDEIRASSDEVDYLLAETNRVFPNANLESKDIHYAYAGVRPLPYRDKGPESAITRKHIIKINKKIAHGLISIIGGKLTTFRNLAEQAVNQLAKVLYRKLPKSRTADTPLPGSWGLDEARSRLQASGLLSTAGIERLLSIYGGRCGALLALAEERAEWQICIDDAGCVLAAEVVFAIREEFAVTLSDIVFRRIMVGFDSDQGRSMYDAIAALAAEEWQCSEKQIEEQLQALRSYASSLLVSN